MQLLTKQTTCTGIMKGICKDVSQLCHDFDTLIDNENELIDDLTNNH